MDPQKKILIVDDEEGFREVLVAKFRSAGFSVEQATDGKEGIKRAIEIRPDLVLMDVKMPNMNGIEALIELRKTPEGKNLKILFLTAFGDLQAKSLDNDRRFAVEIGATDYILKTQDLDQIVSKAIGIIAR